MPVSQFFLMLEESLVLQAVEHSELADIQAISICTVKYYEELKSRYRSVIVGKSNQEWDHIAPLGYNPAVDAKSLEAKNAVVHLLSLVKQGRGL